MVETTYERRDKEGCIEERVNGNHPALGKYVVRASRLLYTEDEAVGCCEWMNQMVADRKGIAKAHLFKVVNYKGSHQTWVVVRQLLANDLVESMDEKVEVKQR